jgi:hypothetical protein
MAETIAQEDPSQAIFAACDLFSDVCRALQQTHRHLDDVLAT